MKKINYLPPVLFAGIFLSTPLLAYAANTGGCSSAGPACTVNTANDGVCTQNTETGDFYCRPTAIPNITNNNSQTTSGFVPLAPITGLTDPNSLSVAQSTNLASFFNNLYKYLIGLAAILAIIEIIWGGLQISTQDSVSKHGEGREHITQAILGLVLVLCPVLVFSIINPAILNLSLNLPPLDTRSGAVVGTGGGIGTQSPPTTNASGCTITGILLKKASCPTQTAAQQFASECAGSGSVLSCQTENSSGCTDTVYQATCTTDSAGPYVFLDTSHYLNPVQLFSNYIPLASSGSNPNNGTQAVQFSQSCTNDGGVTCVTGNGITGGLVSTTCTYSTSQSSSQTNKCYSATLSCKPSSWATTGNIGGGASWLYVCSGSPSWRPIQ